MGGQPTYRGELKFELESSYKANRILMEVNSKMSPAELAAQAQIRKQQIQRMEDEAAKRGEKL